MKMNFELVIIFDKPVLFTCERIDRKDIPKGLFCYDIRNDDDCQGDMVQIKDYVLINHWGTVICQEPFDITQKCAGKVFTTIEGIDMNKNNYNYLDETMTIEEYCDRYEEFIRKYCKGQSESVDMEM